MISCNEPIEFHESCVSVCLQINLLLHGFALVLGLTRLLQITHDGRQVRRHLLTTCKFTDSSCTIARFQVAFSSVFRLSINIRHQGILVFKVISVLSDLPLTSLVHWRIVGFFSLPRRVSFPVQADRFGSDSTEARGSSIIRTILAFSLLT